MKEENKYYTPDMEELHIGYACESFDRDWSNSIINIEDYEWINKRIAIYKYEISAIIRTPYLTKEDIEKEGFIFKTMYTKSDWGYEYEKVKVNKDKTIGIVYRVLYDIDSNELSIFEIDFSRRNYDSLTKSIFKGFCKSINEFRKICKWLNIK